MIETTDTELKANPLLDLPAMREIVATLTPEQRVLFARLFAQLALKCHTLAEASWERRKAPMACYWRAAGVYANHTARGIKRGLKPITTEEGKAQ